MSLLKLAELLKVPAQWFYTLVRDQTKIEIFGKHSDNTQQNSLFVENDGTGMGLFIFGITTRSRHSIEILNIAIDYSTPLQLLDPKKMGFFQTDGSSDQSFPFRIFSEQRFQLRSTLMHVFALIAQFPPGVRELPARISVHARTLRSSVGGVESVGRTQITRKLYRIVLADDRLLGVKVPPKHSLTTIQPFLIQAGLTASGYGVLGSALVHEQFNDGAVSSKIVKLPGAKTEH